MKRAVALNQFCCQMMLVAVVMLMGFAAEAQTSHPTKKSTSKPPVCVAKSNIKDSSTTEREKGQHISYLPLKLVLRFNTSESNEKQEKHVLGPQEPIFCSPLRGVVINKSGTEILNAGGTTTIPASRLEKMPF